VERKVIALLIFKYFPYGGLQRDFIEVAIELLKRKFEVKVLTGTWQGEKISKLDIKELHNKGLTNHAKNKDFFRKAKIELEKINPDLVFGFNKMPGLDIYLAADTCFKYFSKRKNPLFKYLPKYKAFVDYEKAVFGKESNTKSLILNKKQQQEFCDEYDTQKSRLTLIPPGLSQTWRKQIERNNFREELNLNTSSFLFLFVGSSFHRKGLDRAIKALSYTLESGKKDMRLIVAGEDEPDPFFQLAKKLGVQDKVIFLGPRDDIPEIMSSCDLLIHPAREEAAGNVIIESMISELPVLTCGEVGFSSYVEEYNAGKVIREPFKQKDLNDLIFSMSSTSELKFYKENLLGLKEDDFFFSRFQFIGDFIESELYE